MKLYLVQHAEAKQKEEDPERPLSDKGRADIEKVAACLAGSGKVKPGAVLHSGKLRAAQTADVLAGKLGPAGGAGTADGLEPLADPSIWAERLSKQEGDLMLVGHLPHMEKLAARLLCGDDGRKVVAFSMGGVVCLGTDDSGSWAVWWMLVPEIMI